MDDATLPRLIADYGYLAVFVGALLEGEAVLMLAAYAAHQGYLSIWLVVVVAFFGATLGDQIFFLIGRRCSRLLPRAEGKFQERLAFVNRFVLRSPGLLIIGIRFAYGMRIAGPIAIGMSTLRAWRFFVFNAIGALIWAPLIAGAGFLFGQTMEWLLVDFKRYEAIGFAVLICLVVGVTAIGHVARRRRRGKPPS